jgi:hypothetical protein
LLGVGLESNFGVNRINGAALDGLGWCSQLVEPRPLEKVEGRNSTMRSVDWWKLLMLAALASGPTTALAQEPGPAAAIPQRTTVSAAGQ